MPSIFDARIDHAIEQIIGEFGEIVRFNPAAGFEFDLHAIIEEPQHLDTSLPSTAITLFARALDFDVPPLIRDHVIVRGSEYIVSQVQTKPTDPGVNLACALVLPT